MTIKASMEIIIIQNRERPKHTQKKKLYLLKGNEHKRLTLGERRLGSSR